MMDISPQLAPKHVLCGKDKRLTDEEGNKIFKTLISEHFERYNKEHEKSRKMRMTAELLEEFKLRSNGGQFYKYCKKEKNWELCDDGWARDKVSHALRFQIKMKTRRPKLQRNLSLPATASPKKDQRKRSRSDSCDSCPAKIESVPTQELHCDRINDCSSSFDGNGESSLFDPLILFNEMVSSGELDQYYSDFNAQGKNVDTGELYQMGEILTDTEDQYALDDSDDDDDDFFK